MKKMYTIALSIACLCNIACSSKDNASDGFQEGQNEKESPVAKEDPGQQENPTEGFTLGNLTVSKDLGHPPPRHGLGSRGLPFRRLRLFG